MSERHLSVDALGLIQRALAPRVGMGDLVETRIDGGTYLAQLVVDNEQAELRSNLSIGAVTSTGALHALWSLPATPVELATRSDIDIETLGRLPSGLVNLDRHGLVARAYAPIGEVRMLATVSRSLHRGVRRAATIPPIFERLCVWLSGPEEAVPAPNSMGAARRSGTGIVQLCGDQAEVVVAPRARVTGIPAVYRWWVAELAYESKLRQAQSAHAAS